MRHLNGFCLRKLVQTIKCYHFELVKQIRLACLNPSFSVLRRSRALRTSPPSSLRALSRQISPPLISPSMSQGMNPK